MTMTMLLKWGNRDASADINSRFKNVFGKGFASGAVITVSGVDLTVDISDFTLVNFDGAVVVSDAAETVAVADGVNNFVVVRARHRVNDTPILQVQAMAEATYLVDPELDWLHVVGTVDLSSGGPHAAPPASSVQYEERHELDLQGRASWRDPVANFATLPTPPGDTNRDGDVRLVLDTGSLYYWDGTSALWRLFDEVSLTQHRDVEHTNGIVASSNAATLEPGVSGTDLTVQPVAVGDGYTVNGRFQSTPGVVETVAAGTIGAVRGVLQLAYDEDGLLITGYRVTKDADPLDIGFARIVSISDNHALGTFTLQYDQPSASLIWDGGIPVPVVSGSVYRLTNSGGDAWVDVDVSGVAPGLSVSDNYIVSASLKTDDTYLVGYWYWDGAAVLLLGEDKRIFGNLGLAEMSDDFKTGTLYPPMDDLRGDSIYSGGTVTALAGLNVSITGPIVAYFSGRRYVFAAAYAGLAMTPSVLNYLYVTPTGGLTVSTTNPSSVAGLVHVTIATVNAGAGTIGVITDQRDPQLIVGNATRNARIQFSAIADLVATHSSGGFVTWRLRTNGGTHTPSTLDVYSVFTNGGTFSSAGHVTLVNEASGIPVVLTDSAHDNTEILQPGSGSSSVLGAISDAQRAHRGVGTTSLVTATHASGVVTIPVCEFVDFYGCLVRVESPADVAMAGSPAGAYAIVWDGASASFTKKGSISGAQALWRQDFVFATLWWDGAAITEFISCSPISDGSDLSHGFSVNQDAGTDPLRVANFATVREALSHIVAYTSSTDTPPRIVKLLGAIQETNGISFDTDMYVGAKARLAGTQLVGSPASSGTLGRATVQWGTTASALWDFGLGQIPNIRITGVTFHYTGTADTGNTDICVVKNPGPGFVMDDILVTAVNGITCLAKWSAASSALGPVTGTVPQRTELRRVRVEGLASGAPTGLILSGAASTGTLLLDNVIITSVLGDPVGNVSLVSGTLSNITIQVRDSDLEAGSFYFDSTAGIGGNTVTVTATNTIFRVPSGFSPVFGRDSALAALVADVYQCRFIGTGADTIQLDEVRELVDCRAETCRVIFASTNKVRGGDFSSTGAALGEMPLLMATTTARLVAGLTLTSGQRCSMTSSSISVDDTASTLGFSVTNGFLDVDQSRIQYLGANSGDTTPLISMGAAGSARGVRLRDVDVDMGSRPAPVFGCTGVTTEEMRIQMQRGSVLAGPAPVLRVTGVNGAPSVTQEVSSVIFDDVRMVLPHIPDVAGVETPVFGITPTNDSSVYISRFQVTKCRFTIDTPVMFDVKGVSYLKVDDNNAVYLTTANVLHASAATLWSFGNDNFVGSEYTASGHQFQGSVCNNTIHADRDGATGMTSLDVAIYGFERTCVEDNKIYYRRLGVVNGTASTISLLVGPAVDRTINHTAVNRNVVVSATATALTALMVSRIGVLNNSSLISTSEGAFLSVNDNHIASIFRSFGGVGSTASAGLLVGGGGGFRGGCMMGTMDNNTVLCRNDVTESATLLVESVAGLYVGTANVTKHVVTGVAPVPTPAASFQQTNTGL